MAKYPGCNVVLRNFTPVYEVCKKDGQNKLISSLIAFKKKKYPCAVSEN